jgi:hypothetical protein
MWVVLDEVMCVSIACKVASRSEGRKVFKAILYGFGEAWSSPVCHGACD